MRLHFIQHVPFEDPAFILDWAEKNKYPVTSGRAYMNDPYPDYNDFDLLLIMGGPMSVNDEHLLPWLKPEKDFIKECISIGKLVLGICLGAQMIASVLGAKVKPNKFKEIGWFPVHFNENACKTLKIPLSREFSVFHWHGETFDLPEGGMLLASSQACPNQAFAVNNKIFGFQFHMEANKFSIERLIHYCESDLDNSKFVQDKEKMIAEIAFCARANSEMEVFLDWLDTVHFEVVR